VRADVEAQQTGIIVLGARLLSRHHLGLEPVGQLGDGQFVALGNSFGMGVEAFLDLRPKSSGDLTPALYLDARPAANG
jgi:hypothetical protein